MIPEEMRNRARQLRSDETISEKSFWHALRAKRFGKFKFRRQQVIGTYIADFVCMSAQVIVELDGAQHLDAREYDANRDEWLRQQGFQILRVWNNEWRCEPEAVLERLWQMLSEDGNLDASPLPRPLPPDGGGESDS